MTHRRTLRRLIRSGVAALLGSASLLLVWALASCLALALTVPVAHGTAQSAAAAFIAPPLSLALALAFRALLRRVLTRHEAALAKAMARAEGEALMRDPEFLESLNQMARGEHRPWSETRTEMENPDG
jgi:hypothetical protein